MFNKYIDRLKEKLKVKKLDENQPIKAWLFVVILNLIGVIGFIFLKFNGISPN